MVGEFADNRLSRLEQKMERLLKAVEAVQQRSSAKPKTN
jgi:hypothetical protein